MLENWRRIKFRFNLVFFPFSSYFTIIFHLFHERNTYFLFARLWTIVFMLKVEKRLQYVQFNLWVHWKQIAYCRFKVIWNNCYIIIRVIKEIGRNRMSQIMYESEKIKWKMNCVMEMIWYMHFCRFFFFFIPSYSVLHTIVLGLNSLSWIYIIMLEKFKPFYAEHELTTYEGKFCIFMDILAHMHMCVRVRAYTFFLCLMAQQQICFIVGVIFIFYN